MFAEVSCLQKTSFFFFSGTRLVDEVVMGTNIPTAFRSHGMLLFLAYPEYAASNILSSPGERKKELL